MFNWRLWYNWFVGGDCGLRSHQRSRVTAAKNRPDRFSRGRGLHHRNRLPAGKDSMSIFYSPEKLISYNALFNFVIGERGVGKTYGVSKFSVQDFLKHGNEFVYLRRYKSELEKSGPGFFKKFQKTGEFDGHEMEFKNSEFLIDDEVAGYALPLSTANILKSDDTYANVKNIIFDEFIIDKGTYHYLRNEVEQLLDIIETIARLRNIRVFFLGNAISISNPYFAYFDLTLPYGSEFKLFKNGLICVNYIKNMAYRAKKKASRFGQLIEGTSYGRYAIDNEWLRDSKSFIRKKTGACHNWSILVIDGQRFGVWKNGDGFVFISNDYDPNNPCVFAAEVKDHDEQTMLIRARNSSWFKPVITGFRKGMLAFEDQKIKNTVMPILSKCLTY